MKSIQKVFFSILLLLIAKDGFAAGYFTHSKVIGLEIYGDRVRINFADNVSTADCGSPTRLDYYPVNSIVPDKLYTTLLTALVSGRKVSLYVHDPVVCVGTAQRIMQPSFISII